MYNYKELLALKGTLVRFLTNAINVELQQGKLTDLSVLLVLITDLHELDIGFLKLLEDLVLGDEGPILVHDLLHLLFRPVLDRPVLQLRLGQGQEGHNAAL